MRGLCTPESGKFKDFFERAGQRTARNQGAVFFLQCGEGRDFKCGDLEGMDLFGWLVPEAEADEFEAMWERNPNDFEALSAWNDMLCFAEWEMADGKIEIQFKFYDNFYD